MSSTEEEKVSRKVATVLQTRMGRAGPGFEMAQIGLENFTTKMDRSYYSACDLPGRCGAKSNRRRQKFSDKSYFSIPPAAFLNIDHFNTDVRGKDSSGKRSKADVGFAPHPHAGFCPITYVLDDSEGSINNRDTINEQITTQIGPGDLFFNTAGSGMMHEEIPSDLGKNVHGLQIFINLSAKNKGVKPKHSHLKLAKMPLVEEESGTRVRVVLGKHGEIQSPLKTLTPVTMLDVKMPKGATFSHVVPKGWNAFLLVLKGKLTIGPDNTSAPRHSAIGFAVEGDSIDFTSNEDSHIFVAAGEPLNEPIVMDGPFVANSREQLKKMQNDYLQGKMGRLTKSF